MYVLYISYENKKKASLRVSPLCPFFLISTFTKKMIEVGKMKKDM